MRPSCRRSATASCWSSAPPGAAPETIAIRGGFAEVDAKGLTVLAETRGLKLLQTKREEGASGWSGGALLRFGVSLRRR